MYKPGTMKILKAEQKPFHTLSYLQVNSRREIKKAELPFYKVYVDGMSDELNGTVATADLQGRMEDDELLGIAAAKELDLLSELGEIPALNKMGAILCGDFYAREKLEKRGGSGDVSGVWKTFSSRFRWVAGVAGNHDLFSPMPDQKAHDTFVNTPGIHFLDSSWVDLDSLRIAGISGIIGNPGKPFRVTETGFASVMNSFLTTKPNLLLLHEGPDGPDQGCQGNAFIRKELEMVRFPMVAMSGHVQWKPLMISLSEKVTVLNVHERVVVFLRN